ncbi:MAG: ABC transporter ATP-binding protein [Sumerlaeia bacterium]
MAKPDSHAHDPQENAETPGTQAPPAPGTGHGRVQNPSPQARPRRAKKAEVEEEALESFEDWTQIKRLARYLKPRKGAIALAVFLSIIIAGLQLAPGLMVKPIVDDYIVPGNWTGVIWMAGILLVIFLVMFGLQVYTEYQIAKIGQLSMRDLRMDLFRHINKQGLGFFDKRPVGWLITRVTSDVNVLNELFAQGVVGIFQQMFMLVGIVVALLFLNWQLALWTFLVIPVVIALSWFFRTRVRLGYRLTRLRLSRLNTHTQENVTGMKTVHANTQEQRQFGQFEHLNDLHRDAHYRTVFAFATYFPAIEVISAVGLALIVWQGGHQFTLQMVTVGELLAFVLLLERFFAPIRDLSEKFNLVQSAIAASERLFKIFDTAPKINDPESPAAMPIKSGMIEFRDVWFAYNDEDWVLKGVSFKVQHGQKIALVGPTGSGKTTMMALLCRFYDIQKGEILLDGVNIQHLPQKQLRQRIAIVLQDVFLFRGTVLDNIRLGESDARINGQRAEMVATAVNAHTFIERLPGGYDANVMERGATLSVGQKQLLSFARALAFDPEILVLDEATSNIDTETEHLIQAAMERLVEGRTSMIIAHRLSTIQSCDRILVLHHGHLVEEGSHQELLGRDGLYRRLYELQYREQAAV